MSNDFVPAKKGDVVAIRVRAANHDAARPEWWLLAWVERSSRAGKVRDVRLAGQYGTLPASAIGQVYAIGNSEKQRLARKLAQGMKYPGVTFDTDTELKDAIMNADGGAAD